MLSRSLAALSVFLWGNLGTAAGAMDGICSEIGEQGLCTNLKFKSGLSSVDYGATILSISNIIENDFNFYLTESHGPFSEGKTPPIDYEVSFLSAQHESKIYGVTKFVVVSTVTKAKPFGIIVIKGTGALQEIGVSFGYSPYAVLEGKDGMYFLHKDRFSKSVISIKIN